MLLLIRKMTHVLRKEKNYSLCSTARINAMLFHIFTRRKNNNSHKKKKGYGTTENNDICIY